VTRPTGAVVLTYHAIEAGRSPLCIDPDVFEEHLEVVAAASASVVTVSELVDGLAAGTLPERAVAITFDDAIASVGRVARPLLDRHGFRATVFPVVNHVGGVNDWSTQPAHVPRFELLSAAELASLAGAGWEIGSHGLTHRPLALLETGEVEHELETSRRLIAELVGIPARSFAFPYGSIPDGAGAALAAAGYEAAVGARLDRVGPGSDVLHLPRIDAHYVRRPSRLRAVLDGRAGYVRVRRVGARARRLVWADHA
jgi:peptidoglycan/xylan/chitin deacetylase (PgdA/CDA1 family)